MAIARLLAAAILPSVALACAGAKGEGLPGTDADRASNCGQTAGPDTCFERCGCLCKLEPLAVCEDITGEANIVEAYADFRGPVTLAKMRWQPSARSTRGGGGTAGGMAVESAFSGLAAGVTGGDGRWAFSCSFSSVARTAALSSTVASVFSPLCFFSRVVHFLWPHTGRPAALAALPHAWHRRL